MLKGLNSRRQKPRLELLESRLALDASAQAIVTGLYRQMLQRDPDPAGLVAHSARLESGGTIGEIAQGIYSSREFRQNQAENYYDSLLARDADPAGLNHWADQLFSGVPEEQVLAAMASTSEYTGRFASQQGLVNRWYVDLLGRQPDAYGLAAHIQALQSGRSYFEVASALTSSAEFRGVKVRTIYFAALGREADSVGLDSWSGQWQSQGGLKGVTVGILASAENQARLVSAGGVALPDLELASLWNAIMRAPYDESDNGFVQMYNRLLQTNPVYDSGNDPVFSQPGNLALWEFSRSAGLRDGLPEDEKRLVTPVNQPVPYSVLGILPTQNEVDMSQSLRFPLTNPDTLDLYLKGGDIRHPRGLIITGGDGRYVLNGHHRWSTIYCINPQANILSVDIGLEVTPQDYLKVTQIAVGADLGFLPVAPASDSNNLFTVIEADFRTYVQATITGVVDSGQAVLEVFARYGYQDMTAIQDYLWGNVQLLRQNNQPVPGATQREYMPQPLNDDPAPIAAWMQSGGLNYKGPLVPALG